MGLFSVYFYNISILYYYIILSSWIFLTNGDFTPVTLTIEPVNATVLLGSRVVFSCKITENPQHVVMWKHNLTDVAERCSFYNNPLQQYNMVCLPSRLDLARRYVLVIKNVTWKDRGEWMCSYGVHSAALNLTINVNPEVQPVKVASPTGQLLTAGRPFNSDSSTNDPILGASYVVGQRRPISGSDSASQLDASTPRGRGWKDDPYNLLNPGTSVTLHCKTKCAYPAPGLIWHVRNTTFQTQKAATSFQDTKNDCSGPEQNGMLVGSSSLEINCTKLGLYGLLRIRCLVDTQVTKDSFIEFHRGMTAMTFTTGDVFVLCQGGTTPEWLTRGEIVAIAVGCFIVILIILSLRYLTKHRPKSLEDPSDVEIML